MKANKSMFGQRQKAPAPTGCVAAAGSREKESARATHPLARLKSVNCQLVGRPAGGRREVTRVFSCRKTGRPSFVMQAARQSGTRMHDTWLALGLLLFLLVELDMIIAPQYMQMLSKICRRLCFRLSLTPPTNNELDRTINLIASLHSTLFHFTSLDCAEWQSTHTHTMPCPLSLKHSAAGDFASQPACGLLSPLSCEFPPEVGSLPADRPANKSSTLANKLAGANPASASS